MPTFADDLKRALLEFPRSSPDPESRLVTLPAAPDSTRILTHRLDSLRDERAALVAETRTDNRGDAADQATNVEALIRIQLLDERIAAVELEIAELARRPHVDGVVSLGDVVTLDLGQGDETYVVGSVEQVAAGIDTVTPGSPLGSAILGAQVGTTVSYQPRRGVTLDVAIKSVGAQLPQIA